MKRGKNVFVEALIDELSQFNARAERCRGSNQHEDLPNHAPRLSGARRSCYL